MDINIYKFIHYPIEFYFFVVENTIEFHHNPINQSIYIKFNDEFFYLSKIYDNIVIPNFIHNNPLLNYNNYILEWNKSSTYLSSLIQITMIESLYHNSLLYTNISTENNIQLFDFEKKNNDNITIQSFPLHYISYKNQLYLLPLNISYKSPSYFQHTINDIVKIFVPINELCNRYPNRQMMNETRFNQIQQLFHICKPFNKLYDNKKQYEDYIIKSLTIHYKFSYDNISNNQIEQINHQNMYTSNDIQIQKHLDEYNIVCIVFSFYENLDPMYIKYFCNYYFHFVSKIVLYTTYDISLLDYGDKLVIKKYENLESNTLTNLFNQCYQEYVKSYKWLCITNIHDYFVVKKKNNSLYKPNELLNILQKCDNYCSIQTKVIQIISSHLHNENNEILLNQMNKGIFLNNCYKFFNLKYLESLNFDIDTNNFKPVFNKTNSKISETLIKDNIQCRNIEFVGSFDDIQKRIINKKILNQSKNSMIQNINSIKKYYSKLSKTSIDL